MALKKVLVTGAGSGFGLRVALQLAAMDRFHVTAAVHRESQRDKAAQRFADAGLSASVIRLDLLNERDIADAAARDVDILVNNAGYGAQGPILETPLPTARRVFEVNIFGTLALTQQVGARMVSQRRSGRIVFISSVAGLFISAGAGAYSASKFALEAIAWELHEELAPSVTVKVVNPGPFSTGFNEKLVANAPEVKLLDAAYYRETFANFLANQGDPALAIDTIVQAVLDDSPTYRYLVPTSMRSEIEEYRATLDNLTQTIDAPH